MATGILFVLIGLAVLLRTLRGDLAGTLLGSRAADEPPAATDDYGGGTFDEDRIDPDNPPDAQEAAVRTTQGRFERAGYQWADWPARSPNSSERPRVLV